MQLEIESNAQLTRTPQGYIELESPTTSIYMNFQDRLLRGGLVQPSSLAQHMAHPRSLPILPCAILASQPPRGDPKQVDRDP